MLNSGSLLKRVLVTSHPLQKAAQPPKASEKDHLCSAASSPRMTDASPALLLLLSLGLCEYGTGILGHLFHGERVKGVKVFPFHQIQGIGENEEQAHKTNDQGCSVNEEGRKAGVM